MVLKRIEELLKTFNITDHRVLKALQMAKNNKLSEVIGKDCLIASNEMSMNSFNNFCVARALGYLHVVSVTAANEQLDCIK